MSTPPQPAEAPAVRSADVAIIGGGPAGAAAAITLARQGFDAVVIEKERFPRFHVGESLLPYQSALLERLGVAEKVAASGFVPKYGAIFVSGDGSAKSQIDFERSLPEGSKNAFQVDRGKFDELLLEHAREVGAEVLEEHTVTATETAAEDCRLRVRRPDGGEMEVRARWVIDASGQSSLLARRLGLRTAAQGLRKVAHFAHYRGATRQEGRREGDIAIVFGDGCWLWSIPLSGDRVSLGVVTDHARWKGAGGDAEGFYEGILAATPWVAEHLADAERVTPVHTLANFSYSAEQFVGPGYLLAGDAAAFLDPIFSTGVLLALASGELAGNALARRMKKGRPLTEAALGGYEKTLRRWTEGYFRLVHMFYLPQFPAVLFNPVEPFRTILTHFLGGRLDPPLLHRMVVRLFYWVVKLNKTYRICPDPRSERSALPHG